MPCPLLSRCCTPPTQPPHPTPNPCVPRTQQATQVSPWIVTLDALEPFRCDANSQDPPVLPYLRETHRHTWDVALTAAIKPAEGDTETVVTRSNLKHL